MHNDEITAGVKLFIQCGNDSKSVPALGLGVVELCELVESTGSLNSAAEHMEMAYSKAWKIIKNAEEQLGIPLFIRRGGQGSYLTEEAKVLVSIYRHVESETSKRAAEVLDESLEDLSRRGLYFEDGFKHIDNKATPELIAMVKSIAFA